MKLRLIIFCMMISSLGFSQTNDEILTLDECIRIALDNNLNYQNNQLDAQTARANYKRSINNLLPTINGSMNLGNSNGRSIDPYTNSYIDESLTFSNANLGLNAIVFNGFRLLNTLKQTNLNYKAAEMDVEAARQDLMLNVTLGFLQVLSARDLVALTEGRITTSEGQVDRLKTLYDQEVGNPAEYRDLQGQFATDQASLIQARNTLKDALLNLQQWMNTEMELDPDQMQLLIDASPYGYTPDEIYQEALKELPSIKSGELKVEAANKGVAVARSLYVPELSFFANLNTNYSSAARIFTETGTMINPTGDYVSINGTNFDVFREQTSFTPEEIPFKDQFENNVFSNFGLAISIPLFNGFRAKNNVQLEKIKRSQAENTLNQTKLEFRQFIKEAYYDMEAASERYEVLQTQVKAYEESFRINEIRFNNGVTNSVEYIISKTNLDNARVNLANVKYEYVLRQKILDFFRGQI
ncbi:TolC family protein [Aegicerativicinus sediminis]|uniref:TolC family protein n=1 Tax=Aegicerativicinus sediminis TaxID=2893202 RepID=UPI001E2D1917|nr:TolC family protein [Aegicerativicinus sediminis]